MGEIHLRLESRASLCPKCGAPTVVRFRAGSEVLQSDFKDVAMAVVVELASNVLPTLDTGVLGLLRSYGINASYEKLAIAMLDTIVIMKINIAAPIVGVTLRCLHEVVNDILSGVARQAVLRSDEYPPVFMAGTAYSLN